MRPDKITTAARIISLPATPLLGRGTAPGGSPRATAAALISRPTLPEQCRATTPAIVLQTRDDGRVRRVESRPNKKLYRTSVRSTEPRERSTLGHHRAPDRDEPGRQQRGDAQPLPHAKPFTQRYTLRPLPPSSLAEKALPLPLSSRHAPEWENSSVFRGDAAPKKNSKPLLSPALLCTSRPPPAAAVAAAPAADLSPDGS